VTTAENHGENGASFVNDCRKAFQHITTVQNWVAVIRKRQKPQAPTPQAPIRNRQTRKVANAKGLNRNTNLT